MRDALSVVADIGGTNTRVALARGTQVLTDTIRRYRNAEHAGIELVLADFLSRHDARPEAACVDMAGPVKDGVGTLTNIDWRVDAAVLQQATGAGAVAVLNDLQAQGHAVAHIAGGDLAPVLPGPVAAPGAARLVVNVGTGLNAVPVFQQAGLTLVPAAEAGHVTLQALDDEEMRLLKWMQARHGNTGLEEILSGRGLERLHAWACEDEGAGTPLEAAAIMAAYKDGDARAARVVRIFVRYLARYAGDLALITLPFGGIYLVGGVVRHLGPHLLDAGFAEAFVDKGRFADFMAQFPVHLVTDDYAGLRGCAGYIAERLPG
ncbi:ROK family protein [Ponticoccus alexandrii]|uniref:ROK family protein n=1 Tax=Ponticoccus alexandrii TaxID=1943633 RepID=A0ABX7F8Z3_9RHOB|nr:ROK family protein [Ponticoccus alexandrii]ETA51582.1 glucokinase [Rhodobacteraceae bacterium PD-2]QRF66685.1 ROK family protein [Ponticoccus alexandrii]